MLRAVILTLAFAIPNLALADSGPDRSSTSDTPDLIGILRAVHADQCGVSVWGGRYLPLIISDRPLPEESVPGLVRLIKGEYPSGRYSARTLGEGGSGQ